MNNFISAKEIKSNQNKLRINFLASFFQKNRTFYYQSLWIVFIGYRDAECGWVVVEEEEEDGVESSNKEDGKPSKRRALFCVIYAPKRGILEVNGSSINFSLHDIVHINLACILLF